MIYDISPLISKDLAVWPEDTPFSHDVIYSTANDDNITLSKIQTTLHLGAHTDAPNHYGKSRDGISDVNIENYIGECTVIDVTESTNARILSSDINIQNLSKRVLLKTNSFPNPQIWNTDFKSCSAELIYFLHNNGVILIGIDTPSIDLYDDIILESHKAVLENNMSILEGIVLTDVPEGNYELIALPLKIKNADASPVRAILRTL